MGKNECPIDYDKTSRVHRMKLRRTEDLKVFIEKGKPFAPTEK